MNKNWRTNLGGAISVTGTSLIGVGIMLQLTQLSPKTSTMLTPQQLTVLWYVALLGFFLSAIGKGVTAYFSADAKSVQDAQTQIVQLQQVTQAIASAAPPQTQSPPPSPATPTTQNP